MEGWKLPRVAQATRSFQENLVYLDMQAPCPPIKQAPSRDVCEYLVLEEYSPPQQTSIQG